MEMIKSDLISNDTHAKSVRMIKNQDHSDLCLWLKAVATQRDKRAFTLLFKFFSPKIESIARGKFSNTAQASEVVQETMSNVWRKAHLFDESKGAPTTWVYTVMRNVTFDMLRKMQSNKEDTISDDIWPLTEKLSSEEETFEDHLEHKKLLKVINVLPENQQQVIKGYYLMEMSQEQLSVHLGLPLGTIKSRLRLALAKLKSHLGEDHD